MLASIPKVDVIPDGFDWWNAVVGTAGVLIAVVAIIIAIRADRKADKTIATERRRVFELEILREPTRDLDEGRIAPVELVEYPYRLRKYGLRLDLLSSRLPFWDEILDANDSDDTLRLAGVQTYPKFLAEWKKVREGVQALTKLGTGARAYLQLDRDRAGWATKIHRWLPEAPPAIDDPSYPGRVEKLAQAALGEIELKESTVRGQIEFCRAEAATVIAARLTADLDEAIRARIDATQSDKRWWWLLWPPRGFRI